MEQEINLDYLTFSNIKELVQAGEELGLTDEAQVIIKIKDGYGGDIDVFQSAMIIDLEADVVYFVHGGL